LLLFSCVILTSARRTAALASAFTRLLLWRPGFETAKRPSVAPKETGYGAAFCKPGKKQTTVSIKRLYSVGWSKNDRRFAHIAAAGACLGLRRLREMKLAVRASGS